MPFRHVARRLTGRAASGPNDCINPVHALEQLAAPLEEKSLTAFQNALMLAQQKGVYNKWSKNSADFAAKVNPDMFPVSSEPAVQPNHSKDTLLSANFIRGLARGDVRVEFIQIEEKKTKQKVSK